jgi:hypothetical protein
MLKVSISEICYLLTIVLGRHLFVDNISKQIASKEFQEVVDVLAKEDSPYFRRVKAVVFSAKKGPLQST